MARDKIDFKVPPKDAEVCFKYACHVGILKVYADSLFKAFIEIAKDWGKDDSVKNWDNMPHFVLLDHIQVICDYLKADTLEKMDAGKLPRASVGKEVDDET